MDYNLNFILTDERVMPYGHKDRNDTYYFQTLLFSENKRINFYPLLNNVNEIIEFYDLKSITIHFAIMGVGEDGHIAGIFPNINYTIISDYIIFTNNSPKYPTYRVTYNSKLFKKCLNRILVVNNNFKKNFVQKNTENKYLPFSIFKPTKYLFLNE